MTCSALRNGKLFFHCYIDSPRTGDKAVLWFLEVLHPEVSNTSSNPSMLGFCRQMCSNSRRLLEVKPTVMCSLETNECLTDRTAFQTALRSCIGLKAGWKSSDDKDLVTIWMHEDGALFRSVWGSALNHARQSVVHRAMPWESSGELTENKTGTWVKCSSLELSSEPLTSAALIMEGCFIEDESSSSFALIALLITSGYFKTLERLDVGQVPHIQVGARE